MTWGFILLLVILAALIITAAALLPTRSPRRRPTSRHATVVQEIPPGGFGQVRLEQAGHHLLLAASTVGGEGVPAGSVVEIVDDTRSVLVVQRLPNAT